MAFTGYVFHSFDEIEPYAECAGHGPTYDWVAHQAKRLKCTVVCGYVEREKNLTDAASKRRKFHKMKFKIEADIYLAILINSYFV